MSELNIETIGIDTVEPHPENARVGDVSAIAESLERFGQVKPILIQKSTGYVVAGNHTREAAKSLGWEAIQAVLLEMDDETAKAYLLADNRLSDRAKYDQAKLYESLEGLLDLDGTGFDLDYVETLGDALGSNVAANTETGAIVKQAAPEGVTKTQADVKAELAAKPPAEAMRDIVMLMTVSRAQAFGAKVAALQKHYETKTVVDTVELAVDRAVASMEADA